MNGLSLFTGSGIGDLVFREIIPNYRTVCYVEYEPFCVAHLIKSIKDGLIDNAPIWDDIRTFDTRPYKGMVDIVFGGFPCQPFSSAGKNKGAEDERNMWPETLRCINELRPRYTFLENVPNLLSHEYIRTIFGDLASIGYDCEWNVVSARAIGSPILRKRVFILGCNSQNKLHRLHFTQKESSSSNFWDSNEFCDLQNVESSWLVANGFGSREVDGTPNRNDRLKIYGNSWCPQAVARILEVSDD